MLSKCVRRRRVEKECPRSKSERTNRSTARCAVLRESAPATGFSEIFAAKSITKSLPYGKRRSRKRHAKEAIRINHKSLLLKNNGLFACAKNAEREEIMQKIREKNFKSIAKEAKSRLKSGFWENCKDEFRTDVARAKKRGHLRKPRRPLFRGQDHLHRQGRRRRRLLRKGQSHAPCRRRGVRRDRQADRPRLLRPSPTRRNSAKPSPSPSGT